ncbi:Tethering factor for nuclear proteasome sts1 [Cladochytrium tenue]|nr:Tethering factor for nuclear proteasome sts1 [Cladochytrium tenue]
MADSRRSGPQPPATPAAPLAGRKRTRAATDEDAEMLDAATPAATAAAGPDSPARFASTSSTAGASFPAASGWSATPAKRLRLVWTVDDASSAPTHTAAAAPSGSSASASSRSPSPQLLHPHLPSSPGLTPSSSGSPRRRNGLRDSITRSAADATEIVLPLTRILETLQKEDLLNIIEGLVTQRPGLDADVAALIPRPSVSSAVAHLQLAKMKLDTAYPFSRAAAGQDRSSEYAYNRVRTHLAALLELVGVYLTYFTQPAPLAAPSSSSSSSAAAAADQNEYPAVAFGFLHHAATLAASLPRWASDAHHAATRRACWTWVAHAWAVATDHVASLVRDHARMFLASAVADWHADLVAARAAAQELDALGSLFDSPLGAFEGSLGWIIGIRPHDQQMQHQMHQVQQQQQHHHHQPMGYGGHHHGHGGHGHQLYQHGAGQGPQNPFVDATANQNRDIGFAAFAPPAPVPGGGAGFGFGNSAFGTLTQATF